MPQKYRQLAVHNSVCNEVYYKLQDCEKEHPVTRFIGECTSWSKSLEKCIRANRERMREKNKQLAQERQERYKSKISSSTEK